MIAAFERALAISAIAMGIAVLAAATGGCTRTSDGSYVMRKPAMFARVFGLRDTRTDIARLDAGPAVYAVQQSPAPVAPSPRRALPKVAMPTMSIARNPPFKRADPDRPLSCYNEVAAAGRVRVVCM